MKFKNMQSEYPESKNIHQVLKEHKSLDASAKDGMAHAAMLGCGETYLNPFAIFLNGTGFQIGLLAGLPLLIGSVLQTIGVWLTEKISSRLKIIVFLTVLQSLTWLPIALIPFMLSDAGLQVAVLIILAVIYQVAGSLTHPAWNSLIGDLIPVEVRGSFFGYRNRQTALVTFISMIAAGQVLYIFQAKDLTVYGYLTIFIFALASRLISAWYLTKYQDLPYHVQTSDRFSFLQFLLRTPKSNYAKFVLFFACMNFSAYIAGPFFAMYLLNDIQFSYSEYTFIIAIVTSTQFLAMHYWGKLTDQFGNRMIMKLCGVGVAIVPFFWLFSSNFFIIIMIQAFAGFVWAGFNLAAANFMFDAVSPPKRARCVAYQAIINSIFIFFGALLGSYLGTALSGLEFLSEGFNTPKSAFLKIFAISGICRIIVLLALFRLFKEVREVEKIRHRDLIFRITSVRPLSGVGFGVITGLVRKREKK